MSLVLSFGRYGWRWIRRVRQEPAAALQSASNTSRRWRRNGANPDIDSRHPRVTVRLQKATPHRRLGNDPKMKAITRRTGGRSVEPCCRPFCATSATMIIASSTWCRLAWPQSRNQPEKSYNFGQLRPRSCQRAYLSACKSECRRCFMIGSVRVGVRTRRWAGLCLGIFTCIPAHTASAADLQGHADAIGTSRTLVVDTREHPRIGTMQYPETLPLEDRARGDADVE